MFRTLALATALLASATLAAPAVFADDEYNVSVGITAAGAPLGLHGVDPVAFIESGGPVEGLAAHSAVHDGVAYYFATAENAATFKANPAAYLPQNGGFCTFGVSVGKKFDGDPRYHSVVDGKLYVFLNEAIYNMYMKDKAGTIAKAEVEWKRIEHIAATEL